MYIVSNKKDGFLNQCMSLFEADVHDGQSLVLENVQDMENLEQYFLLGKKSLNENFESQKKVLDEIVNLLTEEFEEEKEMYKKLSIVQKVLEGKPSLKTLQEKILKKEKELGMYNVGKLKEKVNIWLERIPVLKQGQIETGKNQTLKLNVILALKPWVEMESNKLKKNSTSKNDLRSKL